MSKFFDKIRKRLKAWLELPDPTGAPVPKKLDKDETRLKAIMDRLLEEKVAQLNREMQASADKLKELEKKKREKKAPKFAPMPVPKTPAAKKPPAEPITPAELQALYDACTEPEIKPVDEDELRDAGGQYVEADDGRKIAMQAPMKYFPPGLWLWRVTDADIAFIEEQQERGTLPRPLPVIFRNGPCDGIGAEGNPYKAPPLRELPRLVCMFQHGPLPDNYQEGQKVSVVKGALYQFVRGPRTPAQWVVSEEAGHPHGEEAVYDYVRAITHEEMVQLANGEDPDFS